MPAATPVTRVTLFVPGARALVDAAGAVEWIENPGDGSFRSSFSFGTVDEPLLQRIDAAPGALLVELPDDLLEGRARVAKAIERLHDRGALAVRVEQSKLGWSVPHWLEVLSSDNPWSLHRCAVTILTEHAHVTSCGMHAFSLPDARVELDEHTSAEEGQRLLSALNAYQLAEDPLLLAGQTFSPDAETPRRVLHRWPDDGYPPQHWCHNPYGMWRLGPPGGKGRPQPELRFQFMPALVVVLNALERKQGLLTRQQVEDARDRAASIAMSHRHAQQIERSRGYADLDPDLAWEQWQLVSANRG